MLSLEGKEISDISSGMNHSFALSEQTQVVYGWGSGLNGKLGNELPNNIIDEPCILKSFEEAIQVGLMDIRQISCGNNHSIALVNMNDESEEESEVTRTNQIFVWGNNAHKQLGMTTPIPDGDDEQAEILSQETGESSKVAEHDVVVPNALSEDFDQFAGSEPIYVEAGINYSATLTKAGEVFTWGGGEFGRIGYLDEKRQAIPRQIIELKNHHITQISLGYYHAAAVDD